MARTKILIPGRTEGQVLGAVLDALHAWGIDPKRQNTGGMYNNSGRYVRFGDPGDPDINTQIPAGWSVASGKALLIETKKEGFDPRRIRGANRERFDKQIARLKRTCDNGGYGLWVSDVMQVVRALQLIRLGWKVVWENDYPFMESEEVDRESDLRADQT